MDLLGHKFEIKDLGPLHYFLGLEVRPTSIGLHLSQTKYAFDLLKWMIMTDCKPCSLITSRALLSNQSGTLLPDPLEFRHLWGSLQHLTLTCPGIAYAVNHLSQFMSRPTHTHLIAAQRILRYAKGSLEHGITFRHSSGPPLLRGYSDANWARCLDTHRSTSGFLLFHGLNLISWSSTKQLTISRSSVKSEYRALAYVYTKSI